VLKAQAERLADELVLLAETVLSSPPNYDANYDDFHRDRRERAEGYGLDTRNRLANIVAAKLAMSCPMDRVGRSATDRIRCAPVWVGTDNAVDLRDMRVLTQSHVGEAKVLLPATLGSL